MTGRLHRAAVEHADYHAANVLVRIGADGLPALWLIDLHRVYFRRTLSPDQRYTNLAFLHQFFTGKSTRADRLRFYRAYQRVLRNGGTRPIRTVEISTKIEKPNDESAEIAEIENYLTVGAHRGWKRADRAWRRGNRHVRKLDSTGGGCRGVAALSIPWLKTIRDDPEGLFRDNVLAWHKRTAKHRVAQIALENSLVAPSGEPHFTSASSSAGSCRIGSRGFAIHQFARLGNSATPCSGGRSTLRARSCLSNDGNPHPANATCSPRRFLKL